MSLTWNLALLTALSLLLPGAGLAQTGHFHPKGKPPSKHTIGVLEKARGTLPFADNRDFEEEKKGFIAAPKSKKIMAKAGNVAADVTAKVEGDVGILEQLASTLVVFDPRFEIMPGTKGPSPEEDLNPYEAGPLELRGE